MRDERRHGRDDRYRNKGLAERGPNPGKGGRPQLHNGQFHYSQFKCDPLNPKTHQISQSIVSKLFTTENIPKIMVK